MRRFQESGASEEDYLNMELLNYEAETGVSFKLLHCWEILIGSLKWMETEVPKFAAKSKEGSSKRHKTFGSSSDKMKGAMKKKGPRASGLSSMNDEALASLMVSEMATQNECAIEMQKEKRLAFLEIKIREVECRKRELANQEYRQRQEDIRFYLQPYDHLIGDARTAIEALRAEIKAKYNLPY
ncbi:zinc finger BED domain-containing protein RICESLEEPER 2-like protein [Tanacetum coccineum]